MTLQLQPQPSLIPFPQKTNPDQFDPLADDFVAKLAGEWSTVFNANMEQLNTIISGLTQTQPIAAWEDSPVSYSFPTVVAGSDGNDYRCVDTEVVGVDPVIDDGTYWKRLGGSSVPVGAIVPWLGGYFSNGSNGGFVNVVGDDAGSINAAVSSDGYRLANGAECNVAGSPYWNTPGRYLANLSDNRFLMGAAVTGGTGGANSMAHTHGMTHTHTMAHSHTIAHYHSTSGASLSVAQLAYHRHPSGLTTATGSGDSEWSPTNKYQGDVVYSGYVGSNQQHYHGNTGGSSASSSGGASTSTTGGASTSTTSGASYTENRPSYLSCHWLQKVTR